MLMLAKDLLLTGLQTRPFNVTNNHPHSPLKFLGEERKLCLDLVGQVYVKCHCCEQNDGPLQKSPGTTQADVTQLPSRVIMVHLYLKGPADWEGISMGRVTA